MKWLVLLTLLLQGCGEHEVKRMIIEPHPPIKNVKTVDCGLHFSKSLSLKETAIQASRISEECSYTDEDFKKLIESELAHAD